MFRPMVLPPASLRAAIGRFHDAGTAAGADDEAVPRLAAVLGAAYHRRPFGYQPRQFPRFVVVAAERAVFLNPCRSEEHDRVLDLLFLKMGQGPQVLRKNSERARTGTLQKGFFAVRNGPPRREFVAVFRTVAIFVDSQPKLSHRTGRLLKFLQWQAAPF